MKILFLIIFFISFNNYVYCNNLFDTPFYNVEFTSKNIEDTKIREIKYVKQESLLLILKRTLTDTDFDKVNKFLNDDLINTFIKNIIINDEKIINNKYISKIKVNYNKKKIIEFFRQKKIPYVDYYPDKFLLIIYEKNEFNNNLFTKNNKYYKYYKQNLKDNNFFKIPNLDINDRFILTEENIDNKNLQKINKFFNKYNSKENIIVIVKSDKNKITYDLFLYLNEEIIEKKSFYNDNETKLFFDILESETLNLWKQKNQIQNKFQNLIHCKVDYYNMLELKEIRNNLKNVSVINHLNKKKIAYRNIEYDIYYYGNLKILSKIMVLNNLKINYDENTCIIRLI